MFKINTQLLRANHAATCVDGLNWLTGLTSTLLKEGLTKGFHVLPKQSWPTAVCASVQGRRVFHRVRHLEPLYFSKSRGFVTSGFSKHFFARSVNVSHYGCQVVHGTQRPSPEFIESDIRMLKKTQSPIWRVTADYLFLHIFQSINKSIWGVGAWNIVRVTENVNYN